MAASVAWATAGRAADSASLAEALFVEGRRLMDQGQLSEACAKLEESQRLDPGAGTQLNLAVCREREGKLATAWSLFKLALADARRDHRDDREALAAARIAALEPRLPSLVVKLAPAVRGDGVTVRLDGLALGAAALGVAMPVDPGAHDVTLTSADGRVRAFTLQAREGVTSELELSPTPAPAAASTRHTWGLVSAGAGAAAIVAGVSFALVARSRQADANAICGTEACSPQQSVAVDKNASAHRWARAADVSLVLGAAGLGVGGYLLVTDAKKSAVTPVVAPGLATVSYVGRF